MRISPMRWLLIALPFAFPFGAMGQYVTLTYQGQYTNAVSGLFDGAPITRVEVDILFPLNGSSLTFGPSPAETDYYDAQVTEVRFGNGTSGLTGDVTSVYATFPITNGAGKIMVEDANVAGSDFIWLIFTNLQTAATYNGNKPSSFNVSLVFNSTNTLRGPAMPIPPPNSGTFGSPTFRDFATTSNGFTRTDPFFSSRRFYVQPTNSTAVASAGIWPSFTFTAEPYVRYQPESAPVLDPNNWSRLGNYILTETQMVVTVSDTNNLSGQAFYRVTIRK